METRASKAARSRHIRASSSSHDLSPLLSLPVELLQLVLGMLAPDDLKALLECSKAMAQQVVQRRSGKTTLHVAIRPGKRWAGTHHLLQWAAPAGLVLAKPSECFAQEQYEDLDSLMSSRALSTAMPEQQFLSLTEMCLQGLELPWVVPPGVADTCPNLFTIKLDNCTVTSSSNSDECSSDSSNCTMTSSNEGSNSSSSSSSSSAAGSTGSRHMAPSICHLRLRNTSLPQLEGAAHMCPVFAEQLHDSLPSLSRLEVEHDMWWLDKVLPQLVTLWSTQLTEVNAPKVVFFRIGAVAMGLTKLIMPNGVVGVELPVLLQLQHLTHLELSIFYPTIKDLSSHACSWQYLHLHLRAGSHLLSPKYLANVPLHSLTSPLLLGRSSADHGPKINLPQPVDAYELPRLQRLANQLVKCGVQMLPNEVTYQPDHFADGEMLSAGFSALMLTVGAPFQAAQKVRLIRCVLDHQDFQALGLVHQHRCRELALLACMTKLHEQAFWSALLTHLPALERLTCSSCDLEGCTEMCEDASLELEAAMAAMTQQPVGRHIEVCIHKLGKDTVYHLMGTAQ